MKIIYTAITFLSFMSTGISAGLAENNNNVVLISVDEIKRAFSILDNFQKKEGCFFKKNMFDGVYLCDSKYKNPFFNFSKYIIPNNKSKLWNIINKDNFWVVTYSFLEENMLDGNREYLIDLENRRAATDNYDESLIPPPSLLKIKIEDNKNEIVNLIQLKISIAMNKKINPLLYKIIWIDRNPIAYSYKDDRIKHFKDQLDKKSIKYSIVIIQHITKNNDVFCIFLSKTSYNTMGIWSPQVPLGASGVTHIRPLSNAKKP
ncbi:MAG: hypothetical protein WC708_16085 [Lentisphaeria bacterium]